MNSDVPLAGQLFRELMIDIFLRNRLAQSQLQLGGQTVNLRHITCPVLNLIGAHDEVVPPTASLSLRELVGSHDARTLHLPTGHLGLAVSRAAHENLWPQVVAWLREREQKRVISGVKSGARPRRRPTSRKHEAGGL
jgi:polyhydroxyalkanoate synthase